MDDMEFEERVKLLHTKPGRVRMFTAILWCAIIGACFLAYEIKEIIYTF